MYPPAAWALASAALAFPAQPLERIVVTAVASRVAEAAEATPATVSAIEREDLERALARDIREALRYEPGVSVENGAARFGLGNISIRGLDGNRVQMLHDGVRLPDGYRIGSFSNASRNPFDTALLARIELLRGPGSALYGSDALAGVMSMTTIGPRDLLKAASGRSGGFADAGYASADGSAHGSGGVAVRAGPTELLVAGAHARGHERATRGEVDSLGATRTVANPQDTRSTSQLAKLVLPGHDGTFWRATWNRFDRRVATDVRSLNPQSPRTVSLAGDDRAQRSRASVDGVWGPFGPVDRLALLVYGQHSLTEQDTAEVRANTTAACLSAAGSVTCRREARFRFEQEEAGVTAIGETARGRAHRFVYGAEWSRTRVEEMRDGRQVDLTSGAATNVVGTDVFPVRDFPVARIERAGAFVQDTIDLGALSLVPAVRFDRFEMRPEPDAVYAADNPGTNPVALTDSAWSPKLGALVPVGRGVTLALQAATGFRAPPYYDVNVGLTTMPLGYAVLPNPDLKPEKSRGLEAGLRGRHAAIDWSLTAYRTDYEDLIVTRAPLPCPGDPRCVPTAPITFQSQNVTRARIEGMEGRFEARLAYGLTARAGFAASRGEDRGKGAPLNSVDPLKVVMGLAWEGKLVTPDARALVSPDARALVSPDARALVSPDARALVTPDARARGQWSGAQFPSGLQLHLTHVARKSRIDFAAGTLFATPAFTTVDLTGHVKLAGHFTISAGVFNLFDRKYWLWPDVRGIVNPGASIDRYTQAGRTFGAQVKATF